tara:strand:+ start:468 stop:1238 length:771 start_codon:yes stop_codon:yes gene_type:complete
MNTIIYTEDLDNNIAMITINRPNQLNALNQEVILDLEKTLESVALKPELRAVILTGNGNKAFVAGADIKEFQDFSKSEALSLSKQGKFKLFNKIANFNKPIIAAINGFALGGGLELALACHIRIASDNSKMGLPECSLGLIPGYGGTQRLTQIVGKGKAMEMILGSQLIDSKEAHNIGLVNYIVEPEQLIDKSIELARSFVKNPPEAISSAIRAINKSYSLEGEDVESEEFAKLFTTDNYKEGVSAFLEKRKPQFK